MTVSRFFTHSVALAAVSSLVACGGGGGDSGAATPPGTASLKLTSANYVAASQESLNSAQTLQAAGTLGNVLVGAEVSNASVLLQFARAQTARLPGWTVGSAVVTGAVLQAVDACDGGGTLTSSLNDTNGNQRADVGESVQLQAANCRFGGSVLNGGMAMTLRSLSGDLTSNVYSLSTSVQFSQLVAASSAGTDTLNGDLVLELVNTAFNTGTSTMAVGSGLELSGSYGGAAYRQVLSNYTLRIATTPVSGGYSDSVTENGTLTSSNLGAQTVLISTINPFVAAYNQDYPASGQAVLAGADGSKVRITALSTSSVFIELDADGNGAFETSTTRAWSSLL